MKIITNLSYTKLAVAAAMVLSFSACKKDNENDAMLDTKISFVNTVEGSTAQDIYIDDVKFTCARNGIKFSCCWSKIYA